MGTGRDPDLFIDLPDEKFKSGDSPRLLPFSF